MKKKKWFSYDKKRVLLEITLRNRNWLIIGVYKAPIQKGEIFLGSLNFVLNKNSLNREKIILIGEFKLTTSSIHLAEFMT